MGPLLRTAALLFAACLVSTGAGAHEFKVGDLEIVHPWSRATPPNAAAAVGYMTIVNHGETPDRLLSVSADFAGPQLHQTVMEGDVMRMRPLKDGVEIAPGGEVAFEPGGNHVMFTGLEEPFVEGELRRATLTFEHAGTVEVEFTVEGMGAGMDHDGDGAMH